MAHLTDEEKVEFAYLTSKVERRKLEIQIKEWKQAFESLALWVRNNFSTTSLFDVLEKIRELRPIKERK